MRTRKFPGKYESLEKIRRFVVQTAEDAGLDQSAVYAVELAVDEACCNIIDHAYGEEGVGDIICSIADEPSVIRIVLEDKGLPFDPSKVPAPQLNLPLEKLKMRGVGFFLMQKLMDEIYYQSSPTSGNVMTLVKHK